MKKLLLLLLLACPTQADDPKLLRCTAACFMGREIADADTCYYTEKIKCDAREVVYVDSVSRICRPVVVNLGKWDPEILKPSY